MYHIFKSYWSYAFFIYFSKNVYRTTLKFTSQANWSIVTLETYTKYLKEPCFPLNAMKYFDIVCIYSSWCLLWKAVHFYYAILKDLHNIFLSSFCLRSITLFIFCCKEKEKSHFLQKKLYIMNWKKKEISATK